MDRAKEKKILQIAEMAKSEGKKRMTRKNLKALFAPILPVYWHFGASRSNQKPLWVTHFLHTQWPSKTNDFPMAWPCLPGEIASERLWWLWAVWGIWAVAVVEHRINGR